MKQNVYKNIIELGFPSSAGHKVYPQVWLIYMVRFYWRKLTFPLQENVNCRWICSQGWEPVSTSSSHHWDPFWLKPVQALGMLPQFLSVYVYISPAMSGRDCFFGVIHFLQLLRSFHLLFHIAYKDPRGRFNEDIPVRTKCCKVSHSLTLSTCVSFLVLVYYKRKLL